MSDSDIFDLSPIAMWIEDFSGVKSTIRSLAGRRRRSISAPTCRRTRRASPSCSQLIRVLRVNRKTLELFEASDLDHLVANLGSVFRDEMLESHVNELAELWDGKTEFTSSAVNYTLSGRRLDIQLRGCGACPATSSRLRRCC